MGENGRPACLWRSISLFRKGFSGVSFWRGLGACGVNNIGVCYEPVCDSFVSVCRLSSAVVPFRRTSDKSRIPFACGLWRDSLILFCCNSPMSVYPLLLRGSLLGNKEKGLGMKTTGNKAFTWFASSYFKATLTDSKSLAGLFIGLLLCVVNCFRYINFANAINASIQVVENYIIIGSTAIYFTGILLGAMFFISDIPKKNGAFYFEIIRIGYARWLLWNIIYIVISVIIYSFFVLIVTSVLSFLVGKTTFANAWSASMKQLAIGQSRLAIESFHISFTYDSFVGTLTPYKAALFTFIYNSLYIVVLATFSMFVNVYGRYGAGWLFSILLHAIGYTAYMNGAFAVPQKLSLFSCAMPALHYSEYYRIGTVYPLIVFSVVLCLLFFLLLDDKKEPSL